ncbi:galactosylceramide sulfotransferase-like isoform X1 [Branchiostoma floridae]|uniref:Galactosylceramide sulfotransferase-like isoform X1 n=1 Tax=Branchiostoma floridae TaxID=7739 RepID=A0A9J7K8V5_BRAFL|nr:galactosylceramide sulfotransferase-like isoform X1 [Branchiostoma floridae]
MAIRLRRQVMILFAIIICMCFVMLLTRDSKSCSTDRSELRKFEVDTFKIPGNTWGQREDDHTSEIVLKRAKTTVNSKTSTKFVPPICRPRTKLALVKTHKTGGTTTMQILHRLAYLKNLSLVLPTVTHPGRMNTFYPHKLTPDRYLPPLQGHQYDMLTYHTIYDREKYIKLVGQEASFITILREPLSHLKSQFNFYNFVQRFNISGKEPFDKFLEDIEMYDKSKPSHLGSRSPMSYDLGMPRDIIVDITQHSYQRIHGQPLNTTTVRYIQDFLKKLSKEMDLVMIMEYFDESLVMLKRLMCWELKDILYYKALSFEYATKEKQVPPTLVENHRKWDTVDYHLYEHFVKIFKQKKKDIGLDFTREVENFQKINMAVRIHCSETASEGKEDLIIQETKWNKAFVVTQEFCTIMKYGQLCYMTLLMDRNHRYRNPKVKNKKLSSAHLYAPQYCNLCSRISTDCTMGEYVTHILHENYVNRYDSSFSRNRHTVDGQNQEDFHV